MTIPRRLVVTAATIVLAAVAAGCSGAASPSATTTGPAVTVSGAWVRAAPDTAQATAAYLVIANGGPAADALLSASSPGAMEVQVHETTKDSMGMSGMHPVARVDVPAGGSVAFAPGGYHLMVMGLKAPLKAGDRLELRLVFEHAGTIAVQAEVRQG